jgi:hypothetical protein
MAASISPETLAEITLDIEKDILEGDYTVHKPTTWQLIER